MEDDGCTDFCILFYLFNFPCFHKDMMIRWNILYHIHAPVEKTKSWNHQNGALEG